MEGLFDYGYDISFHSDTDNQLPGYKGGVDEAGESIESGWVMGLQARTPEETNAMVVK
jgi:hypothetical protein